MAITSNGIAERAFRLAEMSPISSFADDSEEARAAAVEYPVALSQCLEANDWSFASLLADLPASTGHIADTDLPNTYVLPANLVRIIEVWPRETKWRLDSDVLRTDQPAPQRIRYTRTIEDPTKLPSTFTLAVSYRLASILARRFTSSNNRATALYESSVDYLRDAHRADRRTASNQHYDGLNDQSDWVSVALR